MTVTAKVEALAAAIGADINAVRAEIPLTRLDHGGRFYLYTDNRWISAANPTFGMYTDNQTEAAGTGVDPLQEWENIGFLLPAGTVIRDVTIDCRIGATTVTDLEIYIGYRYPTAGNGQWLTGVDADNEVTTDVVYRDFMFNPTGAQSMGFTGPVNDRLRGKLDMGDYETPTDGDLVMFIKPVGIITATTYAYMSYVFTVQLP